MNRDPGNADRPHRRHRRRWWLVAAVVVIVIAFTTAIVLVTGPDRRQAASPPAPTQTTTATPAPAPAPAPSRPASPSTRPPNPPVRSPLSGYLPLWPFANQAEVVTWQQAYRSGGHQPWHLDSVETAMAFTQGYLGYQNVDTLVGRTSAGREDRVSVGFLNPNGVPVTSAVLRLVRFGDDADAPWEVVGTLDTTLSLTQPPYGTPVRSPVTAGGRITGVDESLRIEVLESDRMSPDGQVTGIPAGGDNAPWTASVPFTASRGTVLTIAVSTGGHIADVERFAITGVRH